ncbi:zinc-finger domain-containing protein [Coralliovum pocilloporae]|uniref:zinc-finger domain-containing protein n=1 Tax=Coralliovum pocilloporae TaxID=3066369 RepID=UPI0033079BD2
MADSIIPHFQNDKGVDMIEIGVKEFKCCGATPPYDHPHIFLDMGADEEILCPYCSTLYRYNAELDARDSRPDGSLLVLDAAE